MDTLNNLSKRKSYMKQGHIKQYEHKETLREAMTH